MAERRIQSLGTLDLTFTATTPIAMPPACGETTLFVRYHRRLSGAMTSPAVGRSSRGEPGSEELLQQEKAGSRAPKPPLSTFACNAFTVLGGWSL